MQIDPSQRTAFQRFADAVHAFSNDPHWENFVRYVAASEALEESKRRVTAPRAQRSRESQ